MQNSADMVVMGDLVLDWCCKSTLPFAFPELVSNRLVWARILELPGGGAVHFARYAAEAGFRPLVIGKVGQDYAGTAIIEALKKWGVMLAVERHADLETGRVFIVWDTAPSCTRLLIASTPNANSALTPLDIEPHASAIANAKVLYVSGYCLVDSPRREATQKAFEIARQSGHTLTVLDVVPHEINKLYSLQEFLKLTRHVDVLISEAATVRRFLHLGSIDEKLDKTTVEETIQRLREYYQRFVLRFAGANCNEQVVVDGQKTIWEETGYAEALEKRGYGDRMTVKSLQQVFLA